MQHLQGKSEGEGRGERRGERERARVNKVKDRGGRRQRTFMSVVALARTVGAKKFAPISGSACLQRSKQQATRQHGSVEQTYVFALIFPHPLCDILHLNTTVNTCIPRREIHTHSVTGDPHKPNTEQKMLKF